MDNLLEFTGSYPWHVLALIVSFFVVVFTELRRKASGMVNIEPIAAVQLINNDAVIIDLRSVDAYSQGHIVAARNIPADELDGKMSGLANLKSKPVIAVCDSGAAATKIVSTLREAGFASAYGLKGGMTGWGQAGLPVVTGKKTKAKKAKKK